MSSSAKFEVPDFEYRALQHARTVDGIPSKTARGDGIKKMAIYQLGCQILRGLQIVQDGFACSPNEFYADRELPAKLFSWSREDFVERRQMTLAWLRIMEKYISPECLEQKKRQCDLRELQNYVRIVLQAYVDGSDMSALLGKLEDTRDFISNILSNTVKNLKENTAIYKESMSSYLTCSFFRRVSVQHKDQWETKRLSGNEDIVNLIRMRYNTAHLQGQFTQAEIRQNKEERALQDQINHYHQKIERELVCHRSASACFFHETCKLSTELDELHAKFESEHDSLEARVEYQKSVLQQFRLQKEAMKEVLRVYRQIIASVQAEDLEAQVETAANAALEREKALSLQEQLEVNERQKAGLVFGKQDLRISTLKRRKLSNRRSRKSK